MKEKIKLEDLPDLFGRLVDGQHYSEYYTTTLKRCLANYVIPFIEETEYKR